MRRHTQHVLAGLFVVVGFAPITTLALSLIRVVPLHESVRWVVLPLIVLGTVTGARHPSVGRLALKGLLIGLMAVLLYDCTRLPFILTGVWGDFIPDIATHLFPDGSPNGLVGYTWRYLGNGGGMGVAFVVAHRTLAPRSNPWEYAVAYGVGIWLCLLATLALIPNGVPPPFSITPFTLVMSFVGHVVYGGGLALGLSIDRNSQRPLPFGPSFS